MVKKANEVFSNCLEKIKSGCITLNEIEAAMKYAYQMSEKQLDILLDVYTSLKAGENLKYKKSEDILDAGVLYAGSYGSNSR